MSPVKVAVIGGGIIGLSSAVRAIESIPGIQVTVISEKFSPQTTGDGSAGFWNPYLIGDIDPIKLRSWCQETFEFLLGIFLSPEASSYGVGLLSAYGLSENPKEEEIFSDVFIQWRQMTEKEHSMFPERYKYGAFFTTLFAECTKILPQLMKRFRDQGGRIEKRRLGSLKELIGQYDAVINCPGVEAANLVPDNDVRPIRGQVMRVYAPWLKHAVSAGDFYILPNSEEVICGGTHQEGDWNTKICQNDRESIWRGCCELVPGLKKSKILKEWVGLRPGRSQPRIEHESLESESGKRLEVIHNYGHGGSGVTLFWGCAKEAVQLLEQSLPVRARL